MSEVRIDVLGPFALAVDGAAVTLPTRKAEALLALAHGQCGRGLSIHAKLI